MIIAKINAFLVSKPNMNEKIKVSITIIPSSNRNNEIEV
jgi:hypothetical protein